MNSLRDVSGQRAGCACSVATSPGSDQEFASGTTKLPCKIVTGPIELNSERSRRLRGAGRGHDSALDDFTPHRVRFGKAVHLDPQECGPPMLPGFSKMKRGDTGPANALADL